MNQNILSKEIQQFINDHLDDDLSRLILKGSPFEDIRIRELAEQIESKRKCRSKLPTWYTTPGIYYPHKTNIEQTSSERAAEFKASLVSGETLVDLTGGLGVDSYYFSKNMNRCIYCEIQSNLFTISNHNFGVLNGGKIIRHNIDGIEFINQSVDSYDWIYLDPSRRNDSNEKVFQLDDCSPNVLDNLDLIVSRTKNLMIKLSPFLDISQALRQLKLVEEVYIVALDNEVKELLFLLKEQPQKNTTLNAVNLKKNHSEFLSATIDDIKTEPDYGLANKYLYEPNAAILKAGMFHLVANNFGLVKLHRNSHLYSAEHLIEFPGRRFHVIQVLKYQPKKLKDQLGFEKANITTRNFKESVMQIRGRTRLKEGGNEYLFFTTNIEEQSIVIHCRKPV